MSTFAAATAPEEPQSSIRADEEVRVLLVSLCGERDSDAYDDLLARAVWSRLAEPGDAVAGTVVAQLGPVAALNLLAGPNAVKHLTRALHMADNGAAELSSRQLGAALKRWLPRLDRAQTVRDLATAVSAGMTLVTPQCPEWPAGLGDLGVHAPHALWLRGDATALRPPSLAVVGARACTGYGSHVTAELTGEACAAGFTIVSGAAYGVDAVAHRTALAAGSPTVAVLAGGSDRPYPASHDTLLTRVAAQGAVCSELVPGAAPTRWRFLQRNRVIAALSNAVLVTEAGMRSGSLNTAGHGAEMGRAVGAVPGPITSAASVGCHRLVREYGATLVSSGAELLELLGVAPGDLLTGAATALADDTSRPPSVHVRVVDALPLRGALTTTEVATRAGLSATEAGQALAELELLGNTARRSPSSTGEPRWALRRSN